MRTLLENLGDKNDFANLLDDYPELEGLLLLKPEIKLEAENLLAFLDKMAYALGLHDAYQFGVTLELADTLNELAGKNPDGDSEVLME